MPNNRSFRKRSLRISLRAAIVLASPFILLRYPSIGSAALSAACGETPAAWFPAHQELQEQQFRMSVIDYARQFQGLPYIWGAKKPTRNGFDCSGFTQYVWNTYNAGLPEGAAGQFDSTANPKALTKAKAGDLVFFRENPQAMVSHVALVVSADSASLRVLHSVTSRGVIEEDVLQSPYWRPRIDEVREVAVRLP
jgi:cell wall-associated NlpC family hydrolase